MYIATLMIVLVSGFATARPNNGEDSDEHDNHNDHHNITLAAERECYELTGYTEENLYKDTEDVKFSFCQNEKAKSWLTCFYIKSGLMGDDYVFKDLKDFIHNEEQREVVNNCVELTEEKENNEKACTFDYCIHLHHLINYKEEFGEHDDHHHNLVKECCGLVGYFEGQLFHELEDPSFMFCGDDATEKLMTCFYTKAGLMGEDYEFNEKKLHEELLGSNDKGKIEAFNNCLKDAKTKEHHVKACTFDDCVHVNNITSYDEEFVHSQEDNHDHKHHQDHEQEE